MNQQFEVLYALFANPEITQREISQDIMMSLGKVNRIISELVEMGYIAQGTHKLLEKGTNYLESNKVDNAIIMAAGFGSRFVPITYDTPKGLVEVFGERLVERQIRQLHEAGIFDITIVVGYLKEKFEYLTDKYNVKLLYNPDYAEKNNISTLFYSKKILKNTYILTSDIYMEKNLYRKYEAYSYYVSEFFKDSTSEWACEVSQKNLITKVDPRGGAGVWTMYGPTFFKQDFSTTISDLIDSYYDKSFSSQWYWEDVYMRHLDELEMYIRKVASGTVQEFENVEELRAFDKSYLVHSKSEILDIIARTFKVGLKDIVNIHTLKEGMTNDSFLFSINGEDYVFRAPGKGTDALINRKQEYDVYQIVSPLEISDEIIYLDPEHGYKISRFIKDSKNLDSSNLDEVKRAMTLLKSFHDRNLSVDHEFDIEERINFYHDLCVAKEAIMFEDYKEVQALIKRVIKNLKSYNRPKVLSHIDSVPANFLMTSDEIHLLDWEYSGMADPLIDIGMYVVYDGLDKEGALNLLEIYLERKPSEEEIEIVFSYIALAGFLWSLWTQFKQTQGDNFGTYSIEQYSYAREFARIVLGEAK